MYHELNCSIEKDDYLSLELDSYEKTIYFKTSVDKEGVVLAEKELLELKEHIESLLNYSEK